MVIFVVGLGTIGKPLAHLFLQPELKEKFGISELIIFKNTPELKYRGTLKRFHKKGAKLAVYEEKKKAFQDLLAPKGFGPNYSFEGALDRADVVIDCTKEKVGRQLKQKYYEVWALKRPNMRFIAQGSEKGFGKPFAYTINDKFLTPQDRFIQVVSCNTHQLLCLLKTLIFDGIGLYKLLKARFYINRRASDISQTDSTVGVEVGEPTHDFYGSHQGEDAARVIATLGQQYEGIDIHTIADKSNNPFTHVVNFNITVRSQISRDSVEEMFRSNPLVGITYLQTNNELFSIGRDEGNFGRILHQTVVCLPSLQVREVIDGYFEIMGRCFTPQDGNSLLSSVAATLFFQNPDTYRSKLQEVLYREPFLFEDEI